MYLLFKYHILLAFSKLNELVINWLVIHIQFYVLLQYFWILHDSDPVTISVLGYKGKNYASQL